MRKLNILMVCDAVANQPGGAFISALRFARLLKKRGHRIIFLAALYPNTKKIDEVEGMRVYRYRSIALPKFDRLIRISFQTSHEVDAILKKERIDIVHVIIPTPSCATAIKSARKLNLKVVSHSHAQPENWTAHLPKLLQNDTMEKRLYAYIVKFYSTTDAVVCPSPFAERLLREHNLKTRTVVISNGVDISHFKKTPYAAFLKKYKLNPREKRLLFVGRLSPEKSVETLIEAIPLIARGCSNVRIEIMGVGYLVDTLKQRAQELGVSDRVTFWGRVSDRDLLLAYNACDIFVLPSLVELEGMVVLEAMACAKPLLIANSPESASPDFVKKNGFVFKPKDATDLAKKVIMILKNNSLRKRMSEASLRMSREYDINKSVDKLEHLYYDLIDGQYGKKNFE